MKKRKNLGAMILAAGKGKRMGLKTINKVIIPVGSRPMVLNLLDLLESLSISPIISVVGFAKKSVMDLLGNRVIFAEQNKRLGTAHAVLCGLKKLPENISAVLVINGDTVFYEKKAIENLIKAYFSSSCDIALLTAKVDNPFGLGRVIRNQKGEIVKIVEEKDASSSEREVNEIVPGFYLFKIEFLKKFLKKIKKSSVTGEYYLVDLIELAVKDKRKVISILNQNLTWRGVNTKKELKEAEEFIKQLKI